MRVFKDKKLNREAAAKHLDSLEGKCVSFTKSSFSSGRSLFDVNQKSIATCEYGAALSFFIYQWHEVHPNPEIQKYSTICKLTEKLILSVSMHLFHVWPLDSYEFMQNRRNIYRKAFYESDINLDIMTQLFVSIVSDSIANKKPELFYGVKKSKQLLTELDEKNNLDPLQINCIHSEIHKLVHRDMRSIAHDLDILLANRFS